MTTDFDGEFDHANAVAIQADGKIVAAGFGYRDTDPDDDQEIIRVDFFLARYNPDGSRDTTFGNSGGLFTTFEEGESEAYGVALQGDGKIVAAGCAHCGGGNSVFALARYNTNGSLDPAFDGDGMVITDFGPETSSQAFAVATQEDGKSVAVGA